MHCSTWPPAHGADVLLVTLLHLPSLPILDVETSRGKRTTQLDLNAPADMETLRTLVHDTDVFFQSYRPSSLEERGFGPKTVQRCTQVSSTRPSCGFYLADRGRTSTLPGGRKPSDPSLLSQQAPNHGRAANAQRIHANGSDDMSRASFPQPQPELMIRKLRMTPSILPPQHPVYRRHLNKVETTFTLSFKRTKNSKDFKGKAKVTQSPCPANALPPTNDSSPDEGPIAPTPQSPGLTSPLLISPILVHTALLQAQRLFASPRPGMSYPGTSPPTPLHPTLQDIQRGLFRSNSAAAHLMVLQQVAGSEAYDPSLASPPVTPPPLPGKIFRNNTVGV